MAYRPVNAKSEFTRLRSPGVLLLRNADDGGVFESNRRFHAAVPASNHPAMRPTRGSGLGAVTDMSAGDGEPACVAIDDGDVAHAAAASTVIAPDMSGAALERIRGRRGWKTKAMCDPGWCAKRGGRVDEEADTITGCARPTPSRRA